MPDLKPCPFCGEKKVFIGVHDDEGNYHGLLGCAYESDPWSGLSYALHHEGWGECILCSDGAECIMGGVLFDTAKEAAEKLGGLTMTDLIDREVLLDIADIQGHVTVDDIINADSVDAVPVVRCRECRHLYFKDMSAYCPHRVSACHPDGFCDYGERRADNG